MSSGAPARHSSVAALWDRAQFFHPTPGNGQFSPAAPRSRAHRMPRTGHNRDPRGRCARPFPKPAAVSERAPKFFWALEAGRIYPVPRAEPDDAAAARWDSGPVQPPTRAGFPNEPIRAQVRSPSPRRRGCAQAPRASRPEPTVATTAPPARSAARQFFEARREFPQTDRSR